MHLVYAFYIITIIQMEKIKLYTPNEELKELDSLEEYYLNHLEEDAKRKNKRFCKEAEAMRLKKSQEDFYKKNEDVFTTFKHPKKWDKNKITIIKNLQDFIEALDKNDKRIVNDKKYIDKVWLDLDLQSKSIYEQVLTYFIMTSIDKDFYLNLKFLNSKVKEKLTKKEKIILNEERSFVFKSIKNTFIENFNDKYIFNNIKKNEDFNWKNKLFEIRKTLQDIEDNKEEYRFKLLLLKENAKNAEELKKWYYKTYQKKQNKLNMRLKRATLKLKKEYDYIYQEYMSDFKTASDLKKTAYKWKIKTLKNGCYELDKDCKNKRGAFLKFLDKNPDIDMDTIIKQKKLKTIK